VAAGSSSLEALGLPAQLRRREADLLLADLTALWQMASGRAVGGWLSDLEGLERDFDPVATGKRLRTRLVALPDATEIGPLDEVHALPVPTGRLLITPEGRAAIELLRRAEPERNSDRVVLDEALASRLTADLLNQYRRWGRHRLSSTIELMRGGAAPLQLPAVGTVVMLLINRCDSPTRALPRFNKQDNPRGQDDIDSAVFNCSEAFVSVIKASERRKPGKERLISGWYLGEINRRLPGALQMGEGLNIEPAKRGELVEMVGRELSRRGVDAPRLSDAFDEAVRELRRRSGTLALYDALFERSRDTARLADELAEGLKRARP
jgi:hypothetical protein